MSPGSSIDEAAVVRAVGRFAPIAVYVFGSRASGRVHPGSDVDVAFLPPAPADPYEVFNAAQDLAAVLGAEVDLVDLQRATAVLKAQVVGKGRRILDADPRRTAEFEMYALSDYARANEERRGALAAFVESCRDG